VIYAAYPRKVGKDAALKAITTRIKEGVATEHLLERVNAFSDAVSRWPKHARRFIPHPSTWFNEGRFEDDPAEWERGDGARPEKEADPLAERSIDPARFKEWALGKYPNLNDIHQDPRTAGDRYIREYHEEAAAGGPQS
jgi:hypothetical protein